MAKKRRQRSARGRGSVDQLKSGRYRATLSTGRRPDGKRGRITATFDRAEDAADWLDERRKELRTGRRPSTGKLTLGEWLDRWLTTDRPSWAPNAYHFYESRCRLILKPKIGAEPIRTLTADRIEELYARLLTDGCSVDGVRKAAGTLVRALNRARARGIISYNPAKDVRPPTDSRPKHAVVKALTVSQVGQLPSAATDHRLFALYATWLDSGAREGELFGLIWSDIDWVGNGIQIMRSLEEIKGALRVKEIKTKRNRRVVLSTFTMQALADHRKLMLSEGNYQSDAPVFCSPEGGRLRKSNFRRRAFHPLLKRAGLPHFRPCDLRHTCATLLLAAGESIKVVQERLGHATSRMTLDTYSHVLDGMQGQAANKMDSILRTPTTDAKTDSLTSRLTTA
jgi:integrase